MLTSLSRARLAIITGQTGVSAWGERRSRIETIPTRLMLGDSIVACARSEPRRGTSMRRSITLWAATLGVALSILVLTSTPSMAAQPAACKPGFVWRLANEEDHVCVSAQTRAQVARENQAAASHLAPGQAVACAKGFVWRKANAQDQVCVTPEIRQQTAADNAAASSRIASASL